jgi:hypothetical protein
MKTMRSGSPEGVKQEDEEGEKQDTYMGLTCHPSFCWASGRGRIGGKRWAAERNVLPFGFWLCWKGSGKRKSSERYVISRAW